MTLYIPESDYETLLLRSAIRNTGRENKKNLSTSKLWLIIFSAIGKVCRRRYGKR